MAAVTRYDVNPWKFFAWGMYSRTPITLQLKLGEIARPGQAPRPPRAWSKSTQDAVAEFLARRRQWGRLQPLDEVAATAFREHPDLYGIAIRLVEAKVDPETAMIVGDETVELFYRHATRPEPAS